MDLKHRASQAVEGTQERRRQERSDFKAQAKSSHALFAMRSGALSMGMDEDGAGVETRNPRAFRIYIDKWYVRLGFKKEDTAKMKAQEWKEVEGAIKDGKAPTKLIRIDTHIIAAVRALKHVRKNYENEVAQTDDLMLGLDTLNHTLVEKKSGHSDKEIDDAIKVLDSVGDELTKKRVAVKRIVAKGRLEKAIKMLEAAKEMPIGGKRDFQLGAACAVIVSARNRLSTWRDKEIAGKVEYNHQKECSVRIERDRWLYSQLARFASDVENVYAYWVADKEKVEVLATIHSMAKGKKPKEEIMAYMTQKNSLFRVSDRQRLKAEDRAELMQTGQVRGKKNIDYLMSHYELLYLAIKAEKPVQARRELHHLELFVCSNKPDYILEELSKSPDKYLAAVITDMEAGVEALNFKHFDGASACFGKAREALKPYVYPNRAKS
jgi:hypothetical protein